MMMIYYDIVAMITFTISFEKYRTEADEENTLSGQI